MPGSADAPDEPEDRDQHHHVGQRLDQRPHGADPLPADSGLHLAQHQREQHGTLHLPGAALARRRGGGRRRWCVIHRQFGCGRRRFKRASGRGKLRQHEANGRSPSVERRGILAVAAHRIRRCSSSCSHSPSRRQSRCCWCALRACTESTPGTAIFPSLRRCTLRLCLESVALASSLRCWAGPCGCGPRDEAKSPRSPSRCWSARCQRSSPGSSRTAARPSRRGGA